MPPTNSVIRRYTPPTCTLQIVDRNSPLSRWTERSATSLLQFELRFDDPRLPEEKQISIRGDRYQLESLHQAVTNYVQDLLNSSPDHFNTLLQGQTSRGSDIAVSSTSPMPVTETPQNLERLETSSEFNPEENAPENQTATRTGAIFLQPGKRLTHNLFLGSLATEETGSVIQLGLLQLFDLITALDEYATDVVMLPDLNRTRSTATPSGIWAGIAAVLVLSVGITAVVLPLLNRSNNQQQLANRSAVPDSSSVQQPSLQPSPNSATPPSSLETLPPLPPADPNNPIPSSSPNAKLPGANAPGTLPNVPNNPQVNPRQTTPVLPGTSQANLPQISGTSPLPTLTSPPSSVLVNPVPRQDGASSSKQGDTSGNSSTRSPNFSLSNVPDTVPNSLPQLSSPNIATSTSERTNSTASSAKTRGNTSSSTPDSSATTTEQRLRAALDRQSSGNQDAFGQNIPNKPKTTKVAVASATPQVTEAREFFQKHWQPPVGLRQTLEYSIVLDVDGTIQRIEPLGQASRTYVDRSSLPLIGERFVSPNRSGQTPRIRVVLSPDGNVQTFQETE